MEIEAKFAVPDGETYERLLAAEVLGGYRLTPAVELDLRDLYLDTADRRLAVAGYTLRRRTWADAVTVTLKEATPPAVTDGSGAEPAHDIALRRQEVEVTLAHGGQEPPDSSGGPVEALHRDGLDVAALPPGPLRTRLLAIVGDEPLAPVLTLAQRRLARDAYQGERLVAEVSLDDVTVATAAGEHRYFEIEAEMRPQAGEDDLIALVASLRDEWGLVAETRSKFARAQELGAPGAAADEAAAGTETAAAAAEPEAADGAVPGDGKQSRAREPRRKAPGICVDDTMAEAARKTVRFHFVRMLEHEEGTRAGEDYEELHDMRVATRRMRAALAVFAPYLDAKAYRPYLKDLKRTGRLLGAVRDLDVFHEKAEQYLAQLPEQRRGELDALFDAWRDERERRRRDMLEWLDGGDYRAFVESFAEFLDRPGAGAPADFDADGAPLVRRVGIALPPVVLLELGNVLAFDDWVAGPDVPLARLHRLRIAGKYLRYTLEFFAEVLGPGGKLVVHGIKSLQDHLGDLQDAVVTSGILRDFLSGQGWGRQAGKRARAQGTDLIVAPGVANYLAYKQNELERLVRTFPEAWEPIRSARYRHTIASLLGKL